MRPCLVSAQISFAPFALPSGYGSVRSPNFDLETKLRPLDTDLLDALLVKTDDKLDRTLHALSHAARRDMLKCLTEGDARVTELAARYEGMSLNAVSKHIKVLEQAGLVSRRREGRVHHITLEPEPMRDVEQLLRFFSGFWLDSLKELDEMLDEPDDEPQ